MSAKVTLTVISPNQNRQTHVFENRATCVVGRGDECNIKLTDNLISRHHCLLDINPPRMQVRDLGSKHGTFLNGRNIGQRPPNLTPEEAQSLQLPAYDVQVGDMLTLKSTQIEVDIAIDLGVGENETVIPNNPSPSPTHVQGKTSIFGLIQTLLQRAIGGKDDSLIAIEGYTVKEKLGEGAFGEVYLATHHRTSEQVAIKVMLPEVEADLRRRERFMRELENTKVLHHPNVVQLRDYGFSDGVFFFTLEYCDGGTVEDLMQYRTQPLPVEEAVPIILQVLDGLDYAHSTEIPYVKLLHGGYDKGKGLVHRDIKPNNLLIKTVADSPQIKIADFGVAKAFDQAGLSGFSMSGQHLEGTLPFMPREQVINFKYSKPDVDVWATVACLYYMLTRKFPRDFSGRDPLLTVLQTNPTPIQNYNHSIPKPLAELIDLALVDYPQIHFKTAKAFKTALESVI